MSNERIEARLDQWRPLSWSAIIFGAILALAVSVMLHVLGIGVTASIVDLNSKGTLSTIGGVSGIWFLLATAFGLFVGGFVASTLSRTFSDGRAAIYGLGVWAISSLITMTVVVPVLINGAGSVMNTAGTVAERAANMLGEAGNTAARAGQNAPGDLVDRVERTLLGNGQLDQNAVREIATLLGQRVTQGNWTPQQRDRLNNAVAKAANVPVDEASRRVDDAQNTINSGVQQAEQALRQAAQTARAALAGAAYWAFAALLIGAIAALLGARVGELDESDLPSFARMRVPYPRR